MQALLIADKEYQSKACQELKELVRAFFREKGIETSLTEVERDNPTFCKGCFGCWVKKPGECVIQDRMAQINRDAVNSDAVVYLSPVLFGHFSANIKNAIDRSLPNVLPFFETNPDGLTTHPPRYNSYPREIIIGYGEGTSLEDQELFRDITKKHRKKVEVLFYQGSAADLSAALAKIKLERVDSNL